MNILNMKAHLSASILFVFATTTSYAQRAVIDAPAAAIGNPSVTTGNVKGGKGGEVIYSPTSVDQSTTRHSSGSAVINMTTQVQTVFGKGEVRTSRICAHPNSYITPEGLPISEVSAFGASTSHDIPIVTDPITKKDKYVNYTEKLIIPSYVYTEDMQRTVEIGGNPVIFYRGVFFLRTEFVTASTITRQLTLGASSNGHSVAGGGLGSSGMEVLKTFYENHKEWCWMNIGAERDLQIILNDEMMKKLKLIDLNLQDRRLQLQESNHRRKLQQPKKK